MIENHMQFLVTLQKLGALLDGLEDLQRTVLPQNATLYAVLAETAMEDIRRMRIELLNFSTTKAAG